MVEHSIDRATIRAALRRLDKASIYYILGEALEMLPLSKVLKLIKGHVDLSHFRQDGPKPTNLLEEIKEFQQTSLRGEYYESFDVNWKNSTEKSIGTCAWIFEFNRLLSCCIAAVKKEDKRLIRESMEICFGLLHHIDERPDDIIFFADEAGSWQVGVDWRKVFPAYFRCLSATSQPDEYASLIIAIVDEFEHSSRNRHLAVARKIGTPLQRQALRLDRKTE
jgi:hypothetical protein